MAEINRFTGDLIYPSFQSLSTKKSTGAMGSDRYIVTRPPAGVEGGEWEERRNAQGPPPEVTPDRRYSRRAMYA